GLRAVLRPTETGGGLRAPGESVSLSCRGDDFDFAGYGIWWYRQTLDGRLVWLSYINFSGTMKRYEAAVEGRANVSREDSRLQSSLLLRDLQPQDSALYVCALAR
ncbi:HV01 protein, partial [Rhinopomastus cyanomelas]|nr:HV01 protein [Rhinopomastus cyanomelas]